MTRPKSSSATRHPVHAYARKVVSGKVVANLHVINQCKRHLADLERDDIFFDKAAADRVFQFFGEFLKLSQAHFAGQPFKLEPSQIFILGSIFGWKRTKPDKGTGRIVRRFNRAYIEQGKGNGKSPLLAGIGLYCLMADREPGAQVFVAAAQREQARVIFDDAVSMARQSPALENLLHFHGTNPTQRLTLIKDPTSYFLPWSKEQRKTGSGVRPYAALIDEVHELPDKSVITMLERGFKFRPQPLIIMATNSGSDKGSVCYLEHQTAVDVASGKEKMDNMFPFVCGIDEGDDPFTDEKCWVKANPLLGKIVREDTLRTSLAQAKTQPGYSNEILRLNFCVWTEGDKAWLTPSAWEAIEEKDADRKAEFGGQMLWVGLDLAMTRDLNAMAMVWEDGQTEGSDPQPKYAASVYVYTPKDTIYERAKEDKAPYHQWAEEGWLKAVPGEVMNYSYMVEDLIRLSDDYQLVCVAYDRRYYDRFDTAVESTGKGWACIDHPQNFARSAKSHLAMPKSITILEELIYEKRIRIEYNPLLRSAVSAAQFKVNDQMQRLWKKIDSKSRIDPLVALTMAVGAANARLGRKARKNEGVSFA